MGYIRLYLKGYLIEALDILKCYFQTSFYTYGHCNVGTYTSVFFFRKDFCVCEFLCVSVHHFVLCLQRLEESSWNCRHASNLPGTASMDKVVSHSIEAGN